MRVIVERSLDQQRDDNSNPLPARAGGPFSGLPAWLVHRQTNAAFLGSVRERTTRGRNQLDALSFGATRQQLEDGAFEYKLSEFLRDRIGRHGSEAQTAATVSAGLATRTATRAARAADATINPQKGVFEMNQNDTWQVFIDHAGSAPIPKMCCRWHLNRKCVKNCFNAASHKQLNDTRSRQSRLG
jgi:hypothetical protein